MFSIRVINWFAPRIIIRSPALFKTSRPAISPRTIWRDSDSASIHHNRAPGVFSSFPDARMTGFPIITSINLRRWFIRHLKTIISIFCAIFYLPIAISSIRNRHDTIIIHISGSGNFTHAPSVLLQFDRVYDPNTFVLFSIAKLHLASILIIARRRLISIKDHVIHIAISRFKKHFVPDIGFSNRIIYFQISVTYVANPGDCTKKKRSYHRAMFVFYDIVFIGFYLEITISQIISWIAPKPNLDFRTIASPT